MTYRLHVYGTPPPLQLVGPDWGVGIAPWPTLKPEPARQLWESYGIGAHHFGKGVYADVDAWTQKIADLGIWGFRSGAYAHLDQVKRAVARARELGLKMLGTVANEGTTDDQLAANIELVADNLDVFIGAEGINEPDADRLTDAEVDKTVRFQAAIHKALHGTVPVLSPALRRPASRALYERFVSAGILGTFDVVSLHHYSRGGLPDQDDLAEHIDMVAEVWQCPRMWVTETGNTNATESTDPRSCTEAASAGYAIRNVLEFLDDPRVEKVFRYQLLDYGGALTFNEGHFGVFRLGGAPKPEVAHIRGFTAMTRDDATPFDPPPFEVEVDAPIDVRSRLIQRQQTPPVLWLWRPGVLHDVAPLDVTVRRPTGELHVPVGGHAVAAPLLLTSPH